MALPHGLSLRRCPKTWGQCQEATDQVGKEQCKICSLFSLTPNPVFLPEQRQVVPGKPLLSALIVVEAVHVHIGLQVRPDALLTHPVFLCCALVVFGYCFLQHQHWRRREKAAPALMVCRAGTALRFLSLV